MTEKKLFYLEPTAHSILASKYTAVVFLLRLLLRTACIFVVNTLIDQIGAQCIITRSRRSAKLYFTNFFYFKYKKNRQ